MSKYTPHSTADVEAMLKVVGKQSIDDFYTAHGIEKAEKLNIGDGLSQLEVERYFDALSDKNKIFSSIFRGAGVYRHYIPPVVREMVRREEFVTAYTPYQAEISQGILRSIFEYQTMIARLTGLDVSNASHYDGATAAAESLIMTCGVKNKVIVSSTINPEVMTVIKTYLAPHNIELIVAPSKDGVCDENALKTLCDSTVAAVLLQQPNYYGLIEPSVSIGEIARNSGAKFIMSVNPITLGVLKSPAECGADIAVGEGQPLGMPMGFGGPYLGFIAVKDNMARKLTGRIVGETVDKNGEKAYVLTLQAREQHIRREKASSSICSNEALCALTAAMYLSYVGDKGLFAVGERCMTNAHYLCEKIVSVKGFEKVYDGEFFNEFVTQSPYEASLIERKLATKGILSGLDLGEGKMLWCATEMNSKADIDALIDVLTEVAV